MVAPGSHHIHDISRGEGRDALTAAQLSLIRRACAIECELERLDARLSVGEEVDLDEYGRAASHLRRLFETLGLERRPTRNFGADVERHCPRDRSREKRQR
jgi:hypothetical protein